MPGRHHHTEASGSMWRCPRRRNVQMRPVELLMAQCTCSRHIYIQWALIVVQHGKGFVPRQLLPHQVCPLQHLLQRCLTSLHLHKVFRV